MTVPVRRVTWSRTARIIRTIHPPVDLFEDIADPADVAPRADLLDPDDDRPSQSFNGTVLDEFFRVKMRKNFYDSVEALQADLDAWLVH